MMYAYNSETGEYVSALTADIDLSYEMIEKQVWYIDQSAIKSYDKSRVKNISEINVIYRRPVDRIVNRYGTIYNRAPHFYLPDGKKKYGINIIPESEEHKQIKNWMYFNIIKGNTKFKYSKTIEETEYNNIISLKELDIDYKRVSLELTTKNLISTQRADILIPFKKRDLLFGCGIAIEIQLSKQLDKTTFKRESNYALKGYSVSWIFKDDIKKLNEENIELNYEELTLETNATLLVKFDQESITNHRNTLMELSRKTDEKRAIFEEYGGDLRELLGKAYSVIEQLRYIEESKLDEERIKNINENYEIYRKMEFLNNNIPKILRWEIQDGYLVFKK